MTCAAARGVPGSRSRGSPGASCLAGTGPAGAAPAGAARCAAWRASPFATSVKTCGKSETVSARSVPRCPMRARSGGKVIYGLAWPPVLLARPIRSKQQGGHAHPSCPLVISSSHLHSLMLLPVLQHCLFQCCILARCEARLTLLILLRWSLSLRLVFCGLAAALPRCGHRRCSMPAKCEIGGETWQRPADDRWPAGAEDDSLPSSRGALTPWLMLGLDFDFY